jgi:hypothetical protein
VHKFVKKLNDVPEILSSCLKQADVKLKTIMADQISNIKKSETAVEKSKPAVQATSNILSLDIKIGRKKSSDASASNEIEPAKVSKVNTVKKPEVKSKPGLLSNMLGKRLVDSNTMSIPKKKRPLPSVQDVQGMGTNSYTLTRSTGENIAARVSAWDRKNYCGWGESQVVAKGLEATKRSISSNHPDIEFPQAHT